MIHVCDVAVDGNFLSSKQVNLKFSQNIDTITKVGMILKSSQLTSLFPLYVNIEMKPQKLRPHCTFSQLFSKPPIFHHCHMFHPKTDTPPRKSGTGYPLKDPIFDLNASETVLE